MAGYWGDYRNCDIPLWTAENMFKHISENEEVYLQLNQLNRSYSYKSKFD